MAFGLNPLVLNQIVYPMLIPLCAGSCCFWCACCATGWVLTGQSESSDGWPAGLQSGDVSCRSASFRDSIERLAFLWREAVPLQASWAENIGKTENCLIYGCMAWWYGNSEVVLVQGIRCAWLGCIETETVGIKSIKWIKLSSRNPRTSWHRQAVKIHSCISIISVFLRSRKLWLFKSLDCLAIDRDGTSCISMQFRIEELCGDSCGKVWQRLAYQVPSLFQNWSGTAEKNWGFVCLAQLHAQNVQECLPQQRLAGKDLAGLNTLGAVTEGEESKVCFVVESSLLQPIATCQSTKIQLVIL